IVPLPGSNKLYYVFSLTSHGSSLESCELYYSLVDMRLDSGKGDVVPGEKGILLDQYLHERMLAVSGDDCSIWLLNLSLQMDELRARNIGIHGLDTLPVISQKSGNTSYGALA